MSTLTMELAPGLVIKAECTSVRVDVIDVTTLADTERKFIPAYDIEYEIEFDKQ